MPYKRYDITNTYSYRGRRKNDKVLFKTVMLFVLPLIIVGVLFCGGFISYKLIIKDNYVEPIAPVATSDEELLHEEELLRIVNEADPLDKDYVPELCEVNSVKVNALAVDSLTEMLTAAEKDGVSLKLTGGYVSYEQQAKLHDEVYNKLRAGGEYSQIKAEAEAKKLCPLEGTSESQTGLLLEFNSAQDSDAYKWLVKYSINYGFILRYPQSKESETGMTFNPKLYRYVGKEAAANIRRYDMSLEEYISHISVR